MIPNLKEWKKWSSLERASYVAQLATAAAFLCSSLFAFLSWREAAAARREQRLFFVSEKAPFLEISKVEPVYMNKNRLKSIWVTIKNKGASSAKEIEIDLAEAIFHSPISIQSSSECHPELLEKDRTTMCEIKIERWKFEGDENEVEKVEIKLRPDDYKRAANEYSYPIFVNYNGMFEDNHSARGVLLLSMVKSKKEQQ